MTDAPESPDVVALWRKALEDVSGAMLAAARTPPRLDTTRPFDPMALFRTMSDFAVGLGERPQQLLEVQMAAAREWGEFWASAWLPKAAPAEGEAKPRGDLRECVRLRLPAKNWLRDRAGEPAILLQKTVGDVFVETEAGGDRAGEGGEAAGNQRGMRAVPLHRGD